MGMIHVWEGRDCPTGDTLSPLPRPRSLSHGGFLPFHSPPPSCRPPATLGYLRGEKKLLKEGQWGWPSREALATRRAGELCFGLLRNMPSHLAQQARSRLSQLRLCRSPALCSDVPRQGCPVRAGSRALLPPARAAGHHAHAGWPTHQLVPSLVGGGGPRLRPYSRSVEGLGLHPWFRGFPY